MYGIVEGTKIIFVLSERKNPSVDIMQQVRLRDDLCYYLSVCFSFLLIISERLSIIAVLKLVFAHTLKK